MDATDQGPRGRLDLYGVEYEEFVSGMFVASIGLGTPTREGLRERGYSDAEVDLGTTELLARGFLVRTQEADTWAVVPPRESFPQYLEVVEHRAALARAALSELDNQWRRAIGRSTLASLPDLDVLSSVPQIIERIVTMHRTARVRLWWAMDSSTVTRELLDLAVDDERLLTLAPGVDVRLALDTSVLAEPWALDVLERASHHRYAARVSNGIPFGVIVCDDESVLADISAHEAEGYGSLALRHPGARRAVTRMFEEIWSRATPFRQTGASSPGPGEEPAAPLDDRDSTVLAMLSAGASDQIIARQVGASVRTVERRVRYLMDHLGAATRFQAGVQAARRGWV